MAQPYDGKNPVVLGRLGNNPAHPTGGSLGCFVAGWFGAAGQRLAHSLGQGATTLAPVSVDTNCGSVSMAPSCTLQQPYLRGHAMAPAADCDLLCLPPSQSPSTATMTSSQLPLPPQTRHTVAFYGHYDVAVTLFVHPSLLLPATTLPAPPPHHIQLPSTATMTFSQQRSQTGAHPPLR
jgi:hypothetical protein